MDLVGANWRDVEAGLKNIKTAVLPMGSLEEHGYHLPLSTDTMIAESLVKELAKSRRVIVLPPVCYGLCRTTAAFPGTVSISFEALRLTVGDICESLIQQGLTGIVIVSGHLGSAHISALELAADKLCKEYESVRIALFRIDRALRNARKLLDDPLDMHAGEVETSLMLALHPELVNRESAVDEHPNFPDHLRCSDPRAVMRSGVMGSATLASREKGFKLVTLMLKELSALIEGLEGE